VPRLDASTVLDDHARDDLFGEGHLDWLFATGPDKAHGGKDEGDKPHGGRDDRD